MSKKLLSVILTVCMIASIVTVGVVTPAAAEVDSAPASANSDTAATGAKVEADADTGDDSNQQPTYNPNTATVGQYTTDQVDTSLLVRHTGKTSELIEESNYMREAVDPNNYTSSEEYSQYFHTITSDKQMYETMGYDVSKLQEQAKGYAANTNNQNPLSGFSAANPNELLLGDCNRHSDFDTYLHTYNDVQYMSDIPSDNFDDLSKNTSDVFFHDDDSNWNTSCSNAIGIDVDGDGTDELAYYSLQVKENDDDNMQKGSYIRVQLYDRIPNGGDYLWSKVDEYHMIMEGSNYMYEHTPVYSNKGYVSLAAGDFDDDGNEELAYYMPDKGSSTDSADARVVIENFDLTASGCTHNELAKFYLKDICSDYGEMGNTSYLPLVSLSTTSTRLGNVVNGDTNSAKRYHTYDDLVASVYVPIMAYQSKDLKKNSTTAIFGKKDGSFQNLFQHEYTTFTMPEHLEDVSSNIPRRMYGVNSCDADLNGDGFDEIFVAGYCALVGTYPAYSDSNRDISTIDYKRACANIITYKNDHYEMVWDEPMVIDQSGQERAALAAGYFLIPPISLCAGHFMSGTLELKDQVFINGFVYDLKNTKMSGKPLYYCYNSQGEQTNYIPDTLPGYDKENFPYGYGDDAVKFEEEYYFDLDSLVSTTGAWYDSCSAGHFVNGSEVDQIAVLTWDLKDDFNWDVSILSCSNSSWEVKSHNNYAWIDNVEQNVHGSSIFVTFIDSEEDTSVYRWMGSYCSYSSPVLYSIVQVPPYYEEANAIYAHEIEMTVGNTADSSIDWSAGVGIEGTVGIEFAKFFSSEVTAGLEGKYVSNKTWSQDRSLSVSCDIAAKNDCAVCYITPIIVNVYEVYQSKPTAEALAASDAAYASGSGSGTIERSIVQYSMPSDPIFTAVPIEDYNKAVLMQNDADQPEDTKLAVIDENTLPKGTTGDPVSYCHSLKAVLGTDNIDDSATNCGSVGIAVTNNPNLELINTTLEFGEGTANETGGSVSANLSVKIGGQIGFVKYEVAPSISGEFAASRGTGSTDSVSFGTTYYPPTAENQLLGSLSFDSSEEAYTNSNSKVCHYDPEDGDWYNYNAYAVCYKTNYSGAGTTGVFANGYYSEPAGTMHEEDENLLPADLQYKYPPEQPKEFSIQSVRKNSDGTLDVTLIWDCETRNKNRKADGYNIYMEDANHNLQGRIHLQNKDMILTPSEFGARYMTYSLHLGENDYRDEELNFYIAPAYYQAASEQDKVLEGTISKKATIFDVDDINNTMIITKQPETYLMNDDDADETATFSIEAEKAENFHPTDGDVTFSWVKYDPATSEWETISEETITDADCPDGTFRSSCSLDIEGSDKQSYKNIGVRCIVKCSNSSQMSDLVSFDFHQPAHAINLNTVGYGRLSASAEQAEKGEEIVLTVTPAELHRIKSVKVNDEEITPVEGVYSFIMPSQDVTVTAEFTNINHFVGHSLTLSGVIGVNYFIALTDEEFNSGATVDFTWTVNGVEKTDSVTLTDYNKTEYGYKATAYVAAAEMTYDVTATLKLGGVAGDTDTYSVKQYGDKILTDGYKAEYLKQHTEDEYGKLERLVKTMLDYGAKAQVQFKRNTDKLANEGVDYTMQPVTSDMIYTYPSDMSEGLEEYGLSYAGSTIVYLSRTSLRHYYTITDQDKFDAVKHKITIKHQKADYTEKDGMIYFEWKDIAAVELDALIVLAIDGKEYKYSVLDYVRDCINADDVPYNTMMLVSATYWYNQAANEYFD